MIRYRSVLVLLALAGLSAWAGCGNDEAEKKAQAEALIPQLATAGKTEREELIKQLVGLGAPALEPVKAALPDRDQATRLALIQVLGGLKNAGGLETLTQQMKDQDPEIRAAAATALGVLGNADGLRPLQDAVDGDAEASVRVAAAAALGALNNPRAIPALLRALKDGHKGVRTAAVEALGKLGEPALNPLLEAVQGDDEVVRRGADQALGQLAQKLAGDLASEDKGVREAAVTALGRIGRRDKVQAILPLLRDSEPRVRLAAARALERLPAAAARAALKSRMQGEAEEEGVRLAAAVALGKLGDPAAFEFLIAALASEDSALRVTAAAALAEMGERAAGLLRQALQHENALVRWGAAQALGEIGDKKAVAPLLQRLKDPESAVRAAAILSLGRLGQAEAVEPLLKQLGDASAMVRWSAAWALEEIGAASVTYLLEHLEPASLDPTQAALLGRVADIRARPLLLAGLQSPQGGVREQAAWALGQVDDGRSVVALIQALRHDDPATRREAALALSQVDERALWPPARPDLMVHSADEEEALQTYVKRAVQENLLRVAVTDRVEKVREAAGVSLEKLNQEDLVTQFITALGHEDPAIRAGAARVLGDRGDLRAAAALEKLAKDRDEGVRRAARAAYKLITGKALEEPAKKL